MSKNQVLTILSFVGLFFLLLFGFNTKPQKLIKEEKERSLNLQATDISIIRNEALENLSGDERSTIQILQSKIGNESFDSTSLEPLKDLSGAWYKFGNLALAGYYAEQVAIVDESAQSWGIAGTTYALGVTRSKLDKEKSFCLQKALESLENAISLDPNEIDYQTNRAVLLTEHPPKDNPMQGILILRELNKNFPKNVPVMNNLARFALQTNQLDKALERLNTALALDPTNKMTNCLLVQVYAQMGDKASEEKFKVLCEQF
jgi:tetratricopeptide (TPR) repeat protein